jgi:hypothetical protein
MEAMRRPCVFLLTALVTMLLAAPVHAITYGQPDGNGHPNVGALVDTSGEQAVPYCSGTLIAPTVFLTAAHCGVDNEPVQVTFDSTVTTASPRYAGTFHPDPAYSHRQNDPHDIAVVVLDAAPGLTPAALPRAGQFDKLKGDRQFTAVGYGVLERQHGPGGGKPDFPDNAMRRFATSTLQTTKPAWLQLSMNPSHGDGGGCYGDSGGPNFVGAGAGETRIIAGITITGDTVCRATNVIYRLDTASARHFLCTQGLAATCDTPVTKAGPDQPQRHRQGGHGHRDHRR